ncbi:MAG TPA: hypothetical protein VKB38_01870 [Terracidiphilus sp.]|nr:hypothetical protein [Terracidiphilus sp.]
MNVIEKKMKDKMDNESTQEWNGKNKSKSAPVESGDESSSASLSREQLRNLLNGFLDQLVASRPPAPVNRPSMPTPEDLFRGWQEGGKEKLAEMLRNMPDEDEE